MGIALVLPETVPAQRAPGFGSWKDPVGAYSYTCLRPAPIMDVDGYPTLVGHASAANDERLLAFSLTPATLPLSHWERG
jgi:hypothetical protein